MTKKTYNRILNLSKPNERETWEKMLAEQKVA